MPLETISCSQCGSAEVKEVKANTYFCDHCETVFKHIDASRLAVTPSFCSCGGSVAVRCGSCGLGICVDCDNGMNQYGGGGVTSDRGVVPTSTGLGFQVATALRTAPLDELDQTAREWRQRAGDDRRPWIPSEMVGRTLQGDPIFAAPVTGLARPERHMCPACAESLRAETADRLSELIADGSLCVARSVFWKDDDDSLMLVCKGPATERCPCCGGRSCSEHLESREDLIWVTGHGEFVSHPKLLAHAVARAPRVCWDCRHEYRMPAVQPDAFRAKSWKERHIRPELQRATGYAATITAAWDRQMAAGCRAAVDFVEVAG